MERPSTKQNLNLERMFGMRVVVIVSIYPCDTRMPSSIVCDMRAIDLQTSKAFWYIGSRQNYDWGLLERKINVKYEPIKLNKFQVKLIGK